MSFAEKHKLWLLPILGLGILGVGYMNYRMFRSEAPAAASDASTPEAPPAVEEPAAPEPVADAAATAPPGSAEAGNPASPGPGDLWADLRVFATLPAELADAGRLKDRARMALKAELEDAAPLDLGSAPMVVKAILPPQKTQAETLPSVPAPLPELDFVILGPAGPRAWFLGRPYRVGEVLPGGYTLRRIEASHVELEGPGGRRLEYARPRPGSGMSSNPAVEAP